MLLSSEEKILAFLRDTHNIRLAFQSIRVTLEAVSKENRETSKPIEKFVDDACDVILGDSFNTKMLKVYDKQVSSLVNEKDETLYKEKLCAFAKMVANVHNVLQMSKLMNPN